METDSSAPEARPNSVRTFCRMERFQWLELAPLINSDRTSDPTHHRSAWPTEVRPLYATRLCRTRFWLPQELVLRVLQMPLPATLSISSFPMAICNGMQEGALRFCVSTLRSTRQSMFQSTKP